MYVGPNANLKQLALRVLCNDSQVKELKVFSFIRDSRILVMKTSENLSIVGREG